MPELTGADVEEYEYLTELVTSKGWRVVRNLMNKHRIYCKERSDSFLKRHHDRNAGEWLAKSEESQVLLSLVKDRLQELTKLKGE